MPSFFSLIGQYRYSGRGELAPVIAFFSPLSLSLRAYEGFVSAIFGGGGVGDFYVSIRVMIFWTGLQILVQNVEGIFSQTITTPSVT